MAISGGKYQSDKIKQMGSDPNADNRYDVPAYLRNGKPIPDSLNPDMLLPSNQPRKIPPQSNTPRPMPPTMIRKSKLTKRRKPIVTNMHVLPGLSIKWERKGQGHCALLSVGNGEFGADLRIELSRLRGNKISSFPDRLKQQSYRNGQFMPILLRCGQ